jgi:hypothetical protein
MDDFKVISRSVLVEGMYHPFMRGSILICNDPKFGWKNVCETLRKQVKLVNETTQNQLN